VVIVMSHSSAMPHYSIFRKSNLWPSARHQCFAYAVVIRFLYSVLISVFLWQSSAIAEPTDAAPIADFTATLETALTTLDATNLDDDWYFTMGVVEGGELRIIHSDPRRNKYKRRQLFSVNDVAPDEERQEDFYDAEVERIDGLDPDASDYGYMVDLQTLQLLETGDGYAKFSFVPRVKALEDSREKIRGFLLLNMASRQIDQIEIINTEQLSPAFSVTLDTYRLTLQFKQEQGENLLSRLESHAAGKAGFLKSFESLIEVSFSDYKRADP
jgi:hypothetical protein